MNNKNKIFYLLGLLVIIGIVAGVFIYKDMTSPSAELEGSQKADNSLVNGAEEAVITTTEEESEGAQEAEFGVIEADKNEVNNEAEVDLSSLLDREIVANGYWTEELRQENLENIEKTIEVLKQDADSYADWLNLGLYLKAFEDYEWARDVWEYLATIRPYDDMVLRNLGNLYLQEFQDYVKAEEKYLKAIENDPEEGLTYQKLYELYRYAYTEKANLADDVLMEGIKNNPDDDNLKMLLGEYNNSNQ